MPPCFSQSALVVYWLRSEPEGLAAGDEVELEPPPVELEVPLEPPVEVEPLPPVAPDDPDGALDPELLPVEPLPLLLPPAATRAGVSAMIPASRRPSIFAMSTLLLGVMCCGERCSAIHAPPTCRRSRSEPGGRL
jgi:hypothetical protein